MKSIKKALDYIFIDGLSGMAMGLFATLIIGTILDQIAGFINHPIGAYMAACAAVAKSLTGADKVRAVLVRVNSVGRPVSRLTAHARLRHQTVERDVAVGEFPRKAAGDVDLTVEILAEEFFIGNGKQELLDDEYLCVCLFLYLGY